MMNGWRKSKWKRILCELNGLTYKENGSILSHLTRIKGTDFSLFI